MTTGKRPPASIRVTRTPPPPFPRALPAEPLGGFADAVRGSTSSRAARRSSSAGRNTSAKFGASHPPPALRIGTIHGVWSTHPLALRASGIPCHPLAFHASGIPCHPLALRASGIPCHPLALLASGIPCHPPTPCRECPGMCMGMAAIWCVHVPLPHHSAPAQCTPAHRPSTCVRSASQSVPSRQSESALSESSQSAGRRVPLCMHAAPRRQPASQRQRLLEAPPSSAGSPRPSRCAPRLPNHGTRTAAGSRATSKQHQIMRIPS